MAITLRDLVDLEDKIVEKVRAIEERLRNLELSHRTLKLMVVYNMITNSLIVFLLWQIMTILASTHAGAHTSVGAVQQQGQQIAVVK